MANITAIEAFSDPTRRQLLERLRSGPCSVSDLVRTMAISQPAVSQQLQILRAARLVQVQRQGQQRIYSLNPAGLAELRAYVESFWGQVLGAYASASIHTAEESNVTDDNLMVQDQIVPVTKSFVVGLPVAAAFRLFTADITHWWPLHTHSVFGDSAATCAVDARVGGRIYETHADGRQAEWGQVLAWEPPHRLACSWHPGRDPSTAQELEVTFAAESGGTRVTLVHTGWERLGERGPEARTGYNTGWDGVLGLYEAYTRR